MWAKLVRNEEQPKINAGWVDVDHGFNKVQPIVEDTEGQVLTAQDFSPIFRSTSSLEVTGGQFGFSNFGGRQQQQPKAHNGAGGSSNCDMSIIAATLGGLYFINYNKTRLNKKFSGYRECSCKSVFLPRSF